METKFEISDILKDTRANCYSIITKCSIKEYLQIIDEVYQKKGGISGQRSPLKTKTAQRVRKRKEIKGVDRILQL